MKSAVLFFSDAYFASGLNHFLKLLFLRNGSLTFLALNKFPSHPNLNSSEGL